MDLSLKANTVALGILLCGRPLEQRSLYMTRTVGTMECRSLFYSQCRCTIVLTNFSSEGLICLTFDNVTDSVHVCNHEATKKTQMMTKNDNF